MRGFSSILLLGSGAGLLAAMSWWGLTFWPPLSNNYISAVEAGRCLLADSSLCRLATSLCSARHVQLAAGYQPIVLWLAAAAGFSGFSLAGARR